MESHWLNPNILPTADAYGATPYESSEIDQHVDGARIWATILQIREEFETKTYATYMKGKSWGREEAKDDRQKYFDNCQAEILKAFNELKNGFTKKAMQNLQEVINGINL